MSYDPSPYDDDFEDQPTQGPFYKWVLGVGLPALIGWFGAVALIHREAHFNGRVPIDLYGLNAIAAGTAGVSLALFLHCHYFWGNIYDQAWFAVLGKIIGAIGFIAGLA